MMQVNNKLGIWDQVAVVMAVITVVAAAIVIVAYGRVSDGFNFVTNWPLVMGALASAVWACLFAALMMNVRHSRNMLEVLAADLLTRQATKKEILYDEKAMQDAMEAVLADMSTDR